VFDAVRSETWRLRRLELEQRTLEDVFVEVTQRDSQQKGEGDTRPGGTLPGASTSPGSVAANGGSQTGTTERTAEQAATKP